MSIRDLLKQQPIIVRLHQEFAKLTKQCPVNAFHSDAVLRGLIKTILGSLPVTSFVETGTCFGYSTVYSAMVAPDLSVFTCEINEGFFRMAQARLRPFRNVSVHKVSSEAFIDMLIQANRLGSLPVFFLDAHWYDYWPLQDEVRLITANLDKAILIIDDFRVPGNDEFRYDIGGGALEESTRKTVEDAKPCDWQLIKDHLNTQQRFDVLFPSYTKDDAFPEHMDARLIGYVVIFQNLRAEFEQIVSTPVLTRRFKSYEIDGGRELLLDEARETI